MLDGKQLRGLFFDFNERYWGGRLPPYHIRCVDHITRLGESGTCNPRRKLIRINRGSHDADTISCLLHEMAHAATSVAHGMKWKAEMIRLREAGAPLTQPNSRVALDDWDGVRVKRTEFESAVSEALGDDDQFLTLPEVIRWFITSYGGSSTVAEFLRKYPWARRVFAQVKREATTYRERKRAFRAALAAAKGE